MAVAQAMSTEPRQISAATLYRLSGLALLIAGLLQIAGWLMHPPGERLVDLLSPLQQASHVILFVSWGFALLSLPGLYARQAGQAGWGCSASLLRCSPRCTTATCCCTRPTRRSGSPAMARQRI